MKYLLIFGDCVREALDRKIFYLLVALSLIMSVWCLGLQFLDAPPDKVARTLTGEINDCAPPGVILPPMFVLSYAPNVEDVKGDAQQGLRYRVEVDAAEYLKRVAVWRILTEKAAAGMGSSKLQGLGGRLLFMDLHAEMNEDGTYQVRNAGAEVPMETADLEAYFADRLKRGGMDASKVVLVETAVRELESVRSWFMSGPDAGPGEDAEDSETDKEDPPAGRPGRIGRRGPRGLPDRVKEAPCFLFDVEARGTDEREYRTVEKVGMLFGLFSVGVQWIDPARGMLAGDDATMSRRLIVSLFQRRIVEWLAGLVAVGVGLVVTASFIPDMLRKGTIDLLVSKPIQRPLLLIYKYLGGLTFVFLNAILLIGGTWLALGIASGWFNPWYLATIFVVTFFFAILYTVSTFIAVLTRSTVMSVLVSVTVWFLSWVVCVGKKVSDANLESLGGKAAWQTVVDVLYFLAPKTDGMDDLNSWILSRAFSGGSLSQTILMESTDPQVGLIVGTSLGFIACFIGLSAWIFSRRDF